MYVLYYVDLMVWRVKIHISLTVNEFTGVLVQRILIKYVFIS